MLLLSDSESDSNMKTMLMMQTMSEGNRGLDMSTMLPFLMMGDESDSDSDNLMMMVMMNSMMGGLDQPEGKPLFDYVSMTSSD